MATEQNNQSSYIEHDDGLYGRKIKAVPAPEQDFGIDTKDALCQNIIGAVEAGHFDVAAIQRFTQVSTQRDQLYTLIDQMCADATLASVLETYAEYCVDTNDEGRAVWVETSDANIAQIVTHFLDEMNVDKHVYDWAHSLCKYGDLYIRLFRQSDVERDNLFGTNQSNELQEAVKISATKKNDHYVHYVESERNPARIFELVRLGKTSGYIVTENVPQIQAQSELAYNSLIQRYTFNAGDVTIHQPTDYVHGCLVDNSSRTPEEVEIFTCGRGVTSEDKKSVGTYGVRRGQSLFFNLLKIWREMTLLENSLLLNRVTKSSTTRIVQVEVGDMDKSMVRPHIQQVKQLFEQKTAIDAHNSMSEYSNPGPMENTVYLPTHEGKGAVSIQDTSGSTDVGKIADIEYFRDKFFGALRVPKQYFGYTDDSAGFDGGKSLSITSSRFARMVKRIQGVITQVITDAINLYLLDKGLTSYINKFSIKMVPPTTQEEIDRREAASNRIRYVQDVIGMLSDVENPAVRLKIVKALLSNVVSDSEVIQLL